MRKLLRSIVCALLLSSASIANSEIVVNALVLENQLTREETIKIFLFYRKFWERSGARITVVLPPPNSILFKRLAVEELNLSSTDYFESIKAKMYAGAAQPIFVESESEVLIKIANIPYSIGYYHGNFKINTGFGIRTISII